MRGKYNSNTISFLEKYPNFLLKTPFIFLYNFPTYYVKWPLITSNGHLLHGTWNVHHTALSLQSNLISYYKVKLVNW